MMRAGVPVRIGQRTPAASASVASGVQALRGKLVEVLDDHLVVEAFHAPGLRIKVAKQWELQLRNSDGITREGSVFAKVDADARTVTAEDGGETETHKPLAPYGLGVEREVLAIGGIRGGTGVVVEAVDDQVVQNPNFAFAQAGVWSVDPNGGWAVHTGNGSRHLAGSGAGRIYQLTANPGTLYRVDLLTGTLGSEAGSVRVSAGTEFSEELDAVPSTLYTFELRCSGGDVVAIHADNGTQVAIDSLGLTVIEPGELYYMEITSRVWAQVI